MGKIALITGISGQDGWFLSELLLKKGYDVYGISSPKALIGISHLNKKVHLIQCDLTDTHSVTSVVEKIQPDEIYNLAAQSQVGLSFSIPIYTAEIDALGVLRILDAIRILGLNKKIKFFQASSAELFGASKDFPQTENTSFEPVNPYGIAKLYGYWITKNYRESYGIFASNGIMFNHESEYRGEIFVTRKISIGVAKIAKGLQDKLYLGNLDALRDWGYAKDYVECMWKMLQHNEADDFIIATGKNYSVRDFATIAFREVGIDIHWNGEGINEKGTDKKSGKILVEVNPDFYRPLDTWKLMGDPQKAMNHLGWTHKTKFDDLIKIMVQNDLKILF